MIKLRLVGATACGLLIVKERWPRRLLPYFPVFWHVTLLYCLPFISTIMFLLTHGSIEWLVNVAITVLFLIVLVDWVTFLLLSALGVVLGFFFYRLAIGPISLHLDFSQGYLLVYQGFFATLIGLLFARRKQRRFDLLEHEHQSLTTTDEERKEKLLTTAREKVQLIQTLHYAGIQDLLQVVKLLKELREKLQVSFSPLVSITTQLEATLIPLTLQLRGLTERATDYLRLSVATVSFKDFLQTLQEQLVKRRLDKIVHVHAKTHCQELTCDPTRLHLLLLDSIEVLRAARSHTDRPVLVMIEDTQLHYPLPSVKDGYVKKLSALRLTITTQEVSLPIVQASYGAQLEALEQIYMPENFRELTLHENQRTVKAHYGYSSLQEDVFCYVIPCQLRSVRSKDLDKQSMELGYIPVRANDQYPGAKKLENAFFREVVKHKGLDVELLKSVLELIKWYHGSDYRQSGEPFYLHPLEVAKIVLDQRPQESTVLAALLHDT
ncbi:MAG: hypothetical protein AAFQ08_02635, partial [Bacteroidota bacterium]